MTHWFKLTVVLAVFALIGCSDNSSGPMELETGPLGHSDQPPALTSIFPNPAHPGQVVTIAGSHFGSDRFRVSVTFNGIPAEVRAVSDNALEVAVPLQLEPGDATVTVTVVTCGGATIHMMIVAAPSDGGQGDGDQPPGGGDQPPGGSGGILGPDITDITPNTAQPEQQVAIIGFRFGLDHDGVTATFDGTPGNIVAVADTRIDAVVPAGLQPGTVMVEVTVNGRSDSAALEIVVPDGDGDDDGSGDDEGGGGDVGDGDTSPCPNRVLSIDLLTRTIRLADGRALKIETDALIDASGDFQTLIGAANAITAGATVVACVETRIDVLGVVTVVSARFDLETSSVVTGEIASIDPATATIVLRSGTRVKALADAEISGDHGSLASIQAALAAGKRIVIDAEGFVASGLFNAILLRCNEN